MSSGEFEYETISREMKNLTHQDSESVDVKFDEKLFDCELSEEGINQAAKIHE